MDKWVFVDKSLSGLMKQTDKISNMCSLVGLEMESDLVEPSFYLEEIVVDSLSMLVDDKLESIQWYAYENNYGRNGLSATVDGEERVIDSVENLKWLVEGA